MSQKYLIVIGGPTAIGKTEVAIQLAQHFNTVILSADSRQIYKELNIGVAKPSPEQLTQVKHYFISHISIHQPYTAYDYQKEVHQLLPNLYKKYDIVIMVGGTGFYINAVLNGLNEIPTISSQTKETIKHLYQTKGLQFLQKELAQKDPQYFEKADINNPVRLMRALEVIYETQQPFSAFLNDQIIRKPDYFIPVNLWLNTSRDLLYERINNRVVQMIEKGLEQEVIALYPFKHLNALNTVGYKEWWRYLEKRGLGISSVIQQIQRNTRQYAKRQCTWFKHQWKSNEIYLSAQYFSYENYYTNIMDYIEKYLVTQSFKKYY